MDKRTQRLFLSLPKRLYKDKLSQDIKTEVQILKGVHTLSRNFNIFPFVAVRGNRPVCRCILTIYENDTKGYVGFFEAENDLEAVKFMLNLVSKKAAKLKRTVLEGPLDSSIFIKYRFKLDHFDSTYTGEPVNLPYYPELWEKCGFEKSDCYVSNKLRKVSKCDIDMRFQRVFERYIKRGYSFISPTPASFYKILGDVYRLLIRLYADFPGYKKIDSKQFEDMFGSLKYVLDFNMVRMVYKNDRLCAFCIAIPNYRNLNFGKITPSKLMKILKIKKKPFEYVIMYMGAAISSPGLGCALIQDVRNILYENGCTSIGALIHEGKLTEKMYEDLCVDKIHYALYKKVIGE